MKSFTYRVNLKNGIHARPAGKIVSLCKGYESRVEISNGSHKADGKRLLSLMGLGATYGTDLKITIDGSDEEQLYNALNQQIKELEGGE